MSHESPTGETAFVPVKSADRTLDVLEELASGRATLTDLAVRLHIPKSSLHSILRTLEGRGWVEIDSTRSVYGLGMSALLIGSSYVDRDLTVMRTSDIMDRLAADTGETIHLARIDGPSVTYMAKRESVHPLRMFSAIGRQLPAHATALGKALLAELPALRVQEILPADLAASTPHTITERDTLIEHLEEVRRSGFAVDDEEATVGLRCFAVALPFASPAKDAISCSVPIARLDRERERKIVSQLFEAREEVSRQFGTRRVDAI